jgi:hypothetical protein
MSHPPMRSAIIGADTPSAKRMSCKRRNCCCLGFIVFPFAIAGTYSIACLRVERGKKVLKIPTCPRFLVVEVIF